MHTRYTLQLLSHAGAVPDGVSKCCLLQKSLKRPCKQTLQLLPRDTSSYQSLLLCCDALCLAKSSRHCHIISTPRGPGRAVLWYGIVLHAKLRCVRSCCAAERQVSRTGAHCRCQEHCGSHLQVSVALDCILRTPLLCQQKRLQSPFNNHSAPQAAY